MEFDPLWTEDSRRNFDKVVQQVVEALQPPPYDSYWNRIRDLYQAQPDTLPVAERWHVAYLAMLEQNGYQEPVVAPTFDPPAQTPQEFAAQYVEAITHMMTTHSSHLTLPKNFMERWRKAEESARRG